MIDLSGACEDGFKVFNGWEGIVEVVKKLFPALVFGRLAEADGVIFETVPLD